MFRLLRWLCSFALVLGALWVATHVPLGKRTLYAHLRAIFATPEAQDLADGTREEARRLAERLRGHDAGTHPPEAQPAPATRRPLDPVRPGERRELDRLVREKTHRHGR
jgi:hypothetical protein